MVALWLTWVTRVLTAAVVGVFAAPFLWEVASPDSFMAVTGRSMEPTYYVGDVVSVRPPSGHDLNTIGAPVVVAFTPGDASTQYVHRVVEIVDAGARLKGDNNETVDPGVVVESDVMGTPRFVLSGWLANLFHLTQSWIARAAVAVAIVAVVVMPGTRSGRHRGDEPKRSRRIRERADDHKGPASPEPDHEDSAFADLFQKGAVGCVAAVTALALVMMADPAVATPPPTEIPSFEVAPGEGLFDVVLEPGQSELAIATVTNRSPSSLRLTVSAETASWEGSANPSDYILVGMLPARECDHSAPPIKSAPISRATDRPFGIIAAGESVDVCVVAHLPTDTSFAGVGSSLVHFVFAAFALSSPLPPAVRLPGTGAVVSWVPALAVLLLIGAWVYLSRRKDRHRIRDSTCACHA